MPAVESEGINHSDEWLLKEDAAKFLGTNARSVERRARQGLVTSRYLPKQPNERQARVVYRRADLEAILNGIAMTPATDPVTKRPTTESTALAIAQPPQTAVALAQVDFFGGLATHLAKLSAAFPAPRITKAWLTLEEAVEHSGLPAAELAQLLRAGIIHAIGRGPKTWRVQRASLDAYGEAPHQ
jgi:hypothetical protein